MLDKRMWIAILLLVTGVIATAVWTRNSNSQINDSSAGKVSGVAASPESQGKTPSSVDSISSLIGPLEARLKENPEDPSGWVLLAKSYDYLGQHDRARQAYESAANYGSVDEAVLTALRSRSGVTANKSLDVKSMQQVGDQISQLESSIGNRENHAGVVISGEIAIDQDLLENLPSNRRVFIYARAPGGKGVPLAVTQTTASEFPLSYRLDSSMAMMTGQTLSIDTPIEVSARVSLTGNAISQPGDLVAKSAPLVLAADNQVDLIIDQIYKNQN